MSAAEMLREHGTSAVSDALDLLGVDGGLEGLARRSGTGVVAGPAYTVEFAPVEPGERAPAADYIDDVPAGSVVVVANAGRTWCTVWGDILSEVAQRRGVAGTVVDGCCRDVDDIRALGYPVWSAATYMKSGKNRVRLLATQRPVTVGATAVDPGDLVVADGSGVVVVPAGLVDDVVAGVRRTAEVEAAVRADVARGVPLAAARAARGYHAVALRVPAPS
jgi:regulator of RNase E activity RraA